MRLRPHRRNLVVWSSSAASADRSGGTRRLRPTRASRIRWWLRIGALLMIIGVLRLGRTARTRWEPVSLGVGVLLTVIGFVLPAVAGAYLLGLLVLTVALLKGISRQGRGSAN
jgi:hypothetical protein